MDTFKNAFNQSAKYWLAISLVLIAAFVYLLAYSKLDGFLLLTSYHTKPFDYFFTIYTNLGDGIFIICLVVALFFLKKKLLAMAVLLSYCLSGTTAQVLKNLFPMPRPFLYFKSLNRTVYTIEHVTLTASNASFPSGHTASAFALLTVLLLFFPKNIWNWLFIVLAFLVGYSRMYLSNHFLSDVISGSVIGIMDGILTFIITKKILLARPKWFLDR